VEEQQKQGALPKYRQIWLMQSELARVSAAQGKFGEAEHWFQSSIATVEDAAAKMKREEFRTAMLDNMPVFDDYVAFLIARKQTTQALQIAQRGRARTLAQGLGIPQQRQEEPNIWLAKIQGFLRQKQKGAVILSYFASEKECYLWTITPTQIRLSPLGISRPDLDSLVGSYRQEIHNHFDMEASRAAKKLFQVLVQPASDLTPKGTHVIVVADSRLYSVNFEALIATQGTTRYWIDDVDVNNASSIDLLIAGRHRRAASAKGLLLMGAAVQADPHFPVLPHAPEEMQSVSKHFDAAEVKSFSGPDATPRAYISSSPGDYKYIYLATHGTSNAVEPLKSAIILSPDSHGAFKLLASDIMDKKLRLNADLVTISACEGAGTNVQSLEGLQGLEWAFMRAGAHQVVAALWEVDDAVTPRLVDDFYGEINKHKSTAEALRSAKLAMLHSNSFHSRPYYWASLQLYTGSLDLFPSCQCPGSEHVTGPAKSGRKTHGR
jgi:CHAT domain-containing protein